MALHAHAKDNTFGNVPGQGALDGYALHDLCEIASHVFCGDEGEDRAGGGVDLVDGAHKLHARVAVDAELNLLSHV